MGRRRPRARRGCCGHEARPSGGPRRAPRRSPARRSATPPRLVAVPVAPGSDRDQGVDRDRRDPMPTGELQCSAAPAHGLPIAADEEVRPRELTDQLGVRRRVVAGVGIDRRLQLRKRRGVLVGHQEHACQLRTVADRGGRLDRPRPDRGDEFAQVRLGDREAPCPARGDPRPPRAARSRSSPSTGMASARSRSSSARSGAWTDSARRAASRSSGPGPSRDRRRSGVRRIGGIGGRQVGARRLDELLVADRGEMVGGGEMRRLALGAGQRPVGELADEVLDERDLAAHRRSEARRRRRGTLGRRATRSRAAARPRRCPVTAPSASGEKRRPSTAAVPDRGAVARPAGHRGERQAGPSASQAGRRRRASRRGDTRR